VRLTGGFSPASGSWRRRWG